MTKLRRLPGNVPSVPRFGAASPLAVLVATVALMAASNAGGCVLTGRRRIGRIEG